MRAALAVAILAGSLTPLACSVSQDCTDDGLAGPDGQVYGRDPNQDCQFVDENGDVVESTP